MFPFSRKHGFQQNSFKNSVKRRTNMKECDDDLEMTDEEYLKYIQSNDNNRHQLTRGAHDRYCNKILRNKEDVLLSSLSPIEDRGTPTNSIRLGPNSNDLFRCLLNPSFNRESVSMPSSPTESSNYLNIESTSRRKSDTIANSNCLHEHIVTLKIDDLTSNDEDVSFYRIGPKLSGSASECSSQLLDTCDYSPVEIYDYTSFEYRKIDSETADNVTKLLFGSKSMNCPSQWLRQCFNFSHIPVSRWRLVQMKPGCCGVLVAVEAYLIKCLLFDPGFCKFKEPLRPNQKEVVDAFIHALSYILWQAGDFRRGIVIIPNSPTELDETKSCRSDIVIDDLFTYIECFDFEQLKEKVISNMRYFTSPPYHGYLNFITSVILSRGITRIQADMDNDEPLIIDNGHCSLELVMLLITGRAVSNVFDNDIKIDSCLLKGVKKEVDVGLLSLFEHLNTCEVGSYLKSPKFPVWLVNYADHFTLLFSSKLDYAQNHIQQPFVLYHYDSMTAFSCDNDIKLVIDPSANYSDEQAEQDQTNLQLCIRTKWKNAIVIYADNSDMFLV